MTHAVVIGGSISGLCAARVLADFFDKVTVVERDSYPDAVADRPGVPQSRQYHYLLVRGRRELEHLFPGIDDLMLQRGAIETEIGVTNALLGPTQWVPPRSGFRLPTLSSSRALLEATVRDRFQKLPNVEVVERTDAIGLMTANSGRMRCTGARLRSRDGGTEIALVADLVVDASGGLSRAGEWLRAAGLEPPAETVVDAFAGYASRWYRLRDPQAWPKQWWWVGGVNVPAHAPGHRVTGILAQMERGRWQLTFMGVNGEYPPTREDQIDAFLPKLRSPIVTEMLRLMEPASPLYPYRAPANRWRRYDRWKSRLDGFIAIGDAACVYNPTAGQGMSVAAALSSTLRRCIVKHGARNPALARAFLKAQGRLQRDPWRLAVGNDLRFPGTQGDRPRSLRILNWYRDAVMLASADPLVRSRAAEVTHLLRPVSSLFEPSVLRRVFAARLNAPRADASSARPVPPMPPLFVSGDSQTA